MLFGPPAHMSAKDVEMWDKMNANRRKAGAPELPYPQSADTVYTSATDPKTKTSYMVETTTKDRDDVTRALRQSLGQKVITREQRQKAIAEHNARIASQRAAQAAVNASVPLGPSSTSPQSKAIPPTPKQQPPEKPGMSGMVKLMLGLGVAAGVYWLFFKKQ